MGKTRIETLKDLDKDFFNQLKAQIELDLLDEIYQANDEIQTFLNVLNKIKEVPKQAPKKDNF